MKGFVIMADIVDSGMKEGKSLMSSFRALIDAINESYAHCIESPLTITLGDEFQGVVSSAGCGLDVMIGIEETILEREYDFKLRYVLNEGEIETEINKEQAYAMLGPGLTEARQQLNTMKKDNGRFLLSLSNNSDRMNKMMKLYQHFVDSWHPKDRSTVAGFLEGLDYRELAKKQHKDESTLWRRRKSLSIDEYLTCRELVKEMINE